MITAKGKNDLARAQFGRMGEEGKGRERERKRKTRKKEDMRDRREQVGDYISR